MEVREVTGKFGKFLRSGKKLKFWIKFGINHFYLSDIIRHYYINLTVMCAFVTELTKLFFKLFLNINLDNSNATNNYEYVPETRVMQQCIYAHNCIIVMEYLNLLLSRTD